MHTPIGEKWWLKTSENDIVRRLNQGESMQELMGGMPLLADAFARVPDTLVCADEGVPALEGVKMGVAGQLILADPDITRDFAGKWQGRIRVVASHDGCGAAAIHHKRLKAAGRLTELSRTSDEHGQDHSRQMARLLGADYEHIEHGRMTRPKEMHHARVICVDAHGRFNPAILPDMPTHFLASGLGIGLDPGYCVRELQLLAGIALGDHGYGDRFDELSPLFVMVSAQDAGQLESTVRLCEDALGEFGRRIRVDGFKFES